MEFLALMADIAYAADHNLGNTAVTALPQTNTLVDKPHFLQFDEAGLHFVFGIV